MERRTLQLGITRKPGVNRGDHSLLPQFLPHSSRIRYRDVPRTFSWPELNVVSIAGNPDDLLRRNITDWDLVNKTTNWGRLSGGQNKCAIDARGRDGDYRQFHRC